jgi:hypothetical protein
MPPFLVHLITVVVALAVALVAEAVRFFYEFNAPDFLGVLVLVGGLAIWFLWQIAKLVGWTARKFNSRSQMLRNKMHRVGRPYAEDIHKRLFEEYDIAPPPGFYYLTPKGKKAVLRVVLFRAFPLTHFWLLRRGWVSALWTTRDTNWTTRPHN